jgi:flagellar basal-body rod modification protein FlgD
MTTTTAISPYASLNGNPASTPTANDAASADRFLKLLVTQMQNQDPLNPMDNAQITSQMAQINTVSGIEKLNTTVDGLNGQFSQLQALSGAALVGHDITLAGSQLDVRSEIGVGGYELSGTADHVTVEILDSNKRVVDVRQLGAQPAGLHGFEWDATGLPDGASYSFRITATATAAAIPVPTTSLMRDRVLAVASDGTSLNLETANNGSVAYRDVKAFN